MGVEIRHLYVHAPFCARRCSYCDFAVHVASDPPVEDWAECIGLELRALRRARGWERPLPLETLYVGGGTPSLLGPTAVGRLLESLGGDVALDGLTELTVEANPESYTDDVARGWAEAGVDRISLGTQTFHEPTLRWMGRLHGPGGPGRAVERARSVHTRSVSLDLIFGVPERLERDLDADVHRLLALEPEHVSVYGLSVEPATPLGRWVESGREAMPDQDRYRDEYAHVVERLTAAGYHHYEVSNFARPGHEAVHNAAYWRGVPYVGLGNGAHSYVAAERWWNRRDWFEYRKAVREGGSGRDGREVLAPESERLERIWLGLRTRDGIPIRSLAGPQETVVAGWLDRGWAEAAGDAVRLTTEGWLLLDRLAVALDDAAEPGARNEPEASLEEPVAPRHI